MPEQQVRVFSNYSIYKDRPDLLEAAVAGVCDTVAASENIPMLTRADSSVAHLLSSTERQIGGNPFLRRSLDAKEYIDTLHRNTYMGDAIPTYVISSRNLHYGPEGNYTIGLTVYQKQLAVQSIANIIYATKDADLQCLTTRHVARHESGHMLGMMVPSDYDNPDSRPLPYYGHCANICTMGQVESVEAAIQHAEILAGLDNAGFCIGCINKLKGKQRHQPPIAG